MSAPQASYTLTEFDQQVFLGVFSTQEALESHIKIYRGVLDLYHQNSRASFEELIKKAEELNSGGDDVDKDKQGFFYFLLLKLAKDTQDVSKYFSLYDFIGAIKKMSDGKSGKMLNNNDKADIKFLLRNYLANSFLSSEADIRTFVAALISFTLKDEDKYDLMLEFLEKAESVTNESFEVVLKLIIMVVDDKEYIEELLEKFASNPENNALKSLTFESLVSIMSRIQKNKARYSKYDLLDIAAFWLLRKSNEKENIGDFKILLNRFSLLQNFETIFSLMLNNRSGDIQQQELLNIISGVGHPGTLFMSKTVLNLILETAFEPEKIDHSKIAQFDFEYKRVILQTYIRERDRRNNQVQVQELVEIIKKYPDLQYNAEIVFDLLSLITNRENYVDNIRSVCQGLYQQNNYFVGMLLQEAIEKEFIKFDELKSLLDLVTENEVLIEVISFAQDCGIIDDGQIDILNLVKGTFSKKYQSIGAIFEEIIKSKEGQSDKNPVLSEFLTEEGMKAIGGLFGFENIKDLTIYDLLSYYDVVGDVEAFFTLLKEEVKSKINLSFSPSSEVMIVKPQEMVKIKVLCQDAEDKFLSLGVFCEYVVNNAYVPQIDPKKPYQIKFGARTPDNQDYINKLFNEILKAQDLTEDSYKEKVLEFFSLGGFDFANVGNYRSKILAFFNNNRAAFAYFVCEKGSLQDFNDALFYAFNDGCGKNPSSALYLALYGAIFNGDIIKTASFSIVQLILVEISNSSRDVIGNHDDLLKNSDITECFLSPKALSERMCKYLHGKNDDIFDIIVVSLLNISAEDQKRIQKFKKLPEQIKKIDEEIEDLRKELGKSIEELMSRIDTIDGMIFTGDESKSHHKGLDEILKSLEEEKKQLQENLKKLNEEFQQRQKDIVNRKAVLEREQKALSEDVAFSSLYASYSKLFQQAQEVILKKYERDYDKVAEMPKRVATYILLREMVGEEQAFKAFEPGEKQEVLSIISEISEKKRVQLTAVTPLHTKKQVPEL